MNRGDRELLTVLATRWRVALERTARHDIPGLALFPHGACGDASLMLGEYLRRSGLEPGEYVARSFGVGPHRWATHAWLALRGFIVDITCDQFTHGPRVPVFVEEESAWHRSMQEDLRASAALSRDDEGLMAWCDLVSGYLVT